MQILSEATEKSSISRNLQVCFLFFFVFLAGLYRTEGETVRKGELLVCQGKFNYHPGLNVSASFCF